MKSPTRKTVLLWFVIAAGGGLIVVVPLRRGQAPAHNAALPIRFAFQNRVGSAIPIVAVAHGTFAPHGLNVKPLRFNSGPACAEAIYTGAADIGTMGDTTAIIALASGAPLRIVASHAAGEHRHRLIVADCSPYRTIHDLAGKRIAVKKGTSTYGGFLKYLDRHNVARGDLEVVDMGPAMMPEALAAGSIDAFAASEPTPSLGELHGGRELATFGGLGNTYPIVLVVTERFARGRADDLLRFLAALREAEQLVARNPEAAATDMATATGLPPDVAVKAMHRHTYRLRLDDDIVRSLRQTARFLLEQERIAAVPDLEAATLDTLSRLER